MKRISLFLSKTGQVRCSQEEARHPDDVVEGLAVRSGASSWEIYVKDDMSERGLLSANAKLADKAVRDLKTSLGGVEAFASSLRARMAEAPDAAEES